MDYLKLFDPPATQRFIGLPDVAAGRENAGESVYVYSDEIVLAVNVALATGRPLLVRGASGWGKSTLARNVALTLGRRYYERVIDSRTQARDLLYDVDLLWRLQDAQAQRLAADLVPYVRPGVLWWAFDRESARAQAARSRAGSASEPDAGGARDAGDAVVLLDEIDKADPDLPNNLLVPLGSLSFRVEETGAEVVARRAPLVFVTTNDERELPPAFLRRCVELRIASPAREALVARLTTIGTAHLPDAPVERLLRVAAIVAGAGDGAAPPSAAEYLDAVRASLTLDIGPDSPLFARVADATIWKQGRARPGPR